MRVSSHLEWICLPGSDKGRRLAFPQLSGSIQSRSSLKDVLFFFFFWSEQADGGGGRETEKEEEKKQEISMRLLGCTEKKTWWHDMRVSNELLWIPMRGFVFLVHFFLVNFCRFHAFPNGIIFKRNIKGPHGNSEEDSWRSAARWRKDERRRRSHKVERWSCSVSGACVAN